MSKEEAKWLLFVKCRQGWAGFGTLFYGKKRAMNALQFKNGFLKKTADSEVRKPHVFSDGAEAKKDERTRQSSGAAS